MAGLHGAPADSGLLPQFEDYPTRKIFAGTLAAPKLVTPFQQRYADEIRDGIDKGFGVSRDGKEQTGPNFAGNLIVIQWGCGAPSKRMAMVDARNGDIYYPPISINGMGARSFDLPLLMVGNAVPQNPDVEFRLTSRLMIIRATRSQSDRRSSFVYYFLWRQNGWRLLRRVALDPQ
jgi:hypothetical protein